MPDSPRYDVTAVTDAWDGPALHVPLVASAPETDARLVASSAMESGKFTAVVLREPVTRKVVAVYAQGNMHPKIVPDLETSQVLPSYDRPDLAPSVVIAADGRTVLHAYPANVVLYARSRAEADRSIASTYMRSVFSHGRIAEPDESKS